MVLVDRKTDWFQDEISLDIKKFAWNGTGINREIRDFVLTHFLISRLISSWNQLVFLSTSTIIISHLRTNLGPNLNPVKAWV